MPLGELVKRQDELDRSRTLLMLFRSNRRSAIAAQQLAAKGSHILNIAGGILA